MSPFMSRFPELGAAEMRSMQISDGPPGEVPGGVYSLVEYYCDEPGCDCRRVHIQFVTTRPKRVWATFGFGWESPKFYAKWSSTDVAKEMSGLSIEPFGPQSEYTNQLFGLLQNILEDRAYVARLARHYQMFKANSEFAEADFSMAPHLGLTPQERAEARRQLRKRTRRREKKK